jgi:predicted P-loop ATPase
MEGRGLSFKSIGRELMRDAVAKVATENQFDSAQIWLRSLQWDGVPRVGRFLARYFAVEDSPYHEAVSRYLWTALAGRVLQPGCKADMVPVLIGRQGLRKSSAVAAMSPSLECFTEVSLSERDADLSRKMRGVLVAEIGELRGLNSRDLEWIKSFITSTHERWTPKYKEFETVFPRRLVFVATTNQEEFLADLTGNRRWLPVRVCEADVEGIAADVSQLWAEAAVLFSLLGVCWAEAERLSAGVHAEHMITDPWMDRIVEWLSVEEVDGGKATMRDFLLTHEVLRSALGHDLKNCGKRDEMRVAACLHALGYERVLRRVNGKPTRVWMRPPEATS